MSEEILDPKKRGYIFAPRKNNPAIKDKVYIETDISAIEDDRNTQIQSLKVTLNEMDGKINTFRIIDDITTITELSTPVCAVQTVDTESYPIGIYMISTSGAITSIGSIDKGFEVMTSMPDDPNDTQLLTAKCIKEYINDMIV